MLPNRNEEPFETDSQGDSDSGMCSKDDLNSSIETESTESTSLDSSSKDSSSNSHMRKDSDSSFEHFELYETPHTFRYRGPYLLKGEEDTGEQSHEWPLHNLPHRTQFYHRKRGIWKLFALPPRYYYTLAVILTSIVYTTCCSDPVYSRQYKDWRFFLYKQAPVIQQQIRQDGPGESFTILLKGRRLDFLQQSIDAHSMCGSVKEVQIDYGSKPIPEVILSRGLNVVPRRQITTNAVFLLTEDIILTCDEIEKAFQAWKKDTSRLVGFFGFRQSYSSDSAAGSSFGVRSAAIDFESVPAGSGPYSMVSDRAVFVHNLYITSIPPKPTSQDSMCCQLLLSSQVSAASSKAPIVIKANPRELLNNNKVNNSATRKGSVEGINSKESACFRECIPNWLRINLPDEMMTVIR